MNQDRFQLRAEVQVVTNARDIERFDPHAIASQHQPAVSLLPEGYREHPAQTRETFRVPLEERMEDSFGVAVGAAAMSALFQVPAQCQVIVDLAVEYDDGVAIG